MKHDKKRTAAFLAAGMLAVMLAGCGSKPSQEKIRQALDDGTISVEDAKEKGWIDEAWIKENYPPVEASNKVHLFDPFTTTYLDGSEASSSIISGKTCLVFFNSAYSGTVEQLAVFDGIADQLKEIGIPLIGISTDEDLAAAQERLGELNFPVIVYNSEMKTALSKYDSMLGGELRYVLTKDGGFYTAWRTSVVENDIVEEAKRLVAEE